jgi:Tfp pilus assembly protein PilO
MTASDLSDFVKKQPVGVICALLSVALGATLYLRSGVIGDKQAEFDAKSIEAAKIISNVNNSKNLSDQVEEIKVLTKDLESRLVRAGQLAVNLQYFYKLEAENEVKLLDIRQNAVSKNSTGLYQGIPYNLSIQGTYKQVMTFLNRLENGRHFCRFTSVVFNKAPGSDISSQTTMTVSLSLELLGQP